MKHRTWEQSEDLARRISGLKSDKFTSRQIGKKLGIKPALVRYYCRKDCRAAQRAA